MMKMTRTALLAAVTVVVSFGGSSVPVVADDTEIFETQAIGNTSARPKVLVMFDDSGSMDTIVAGQRPPYDPDKTDYLGGITGSEFNRVYWSTNGQVPEADSDQWFDVGVNRCASSYAPLDNQGFFGADGARRWINSSTGQENCRTFCSSNGNDVTNSGFGQFLCVFFGGSLYQVCDTVDIPGSWGALSTNVHSPDHVDCEVDVDPDAPQAGNGPGVADGFPKTDVNDGQEYSAATVGASDVDWGSTSYTFYSANYIDYWNDDSLIQDRTRIEIAQDVVSTIIQANPGIDFGLATFNYNSDGDGGGDANNASQNHGGRIIRRIIEGMSDTQRTNLVDMVEDDLTASGNTPLCETFSEVYRYFTEAPVHWGDNRETAGTPDIDLPERDTAAESGGSYVSPLADCANIYVIMMTDGEPTSDLASNNYIKSLPGIDPDNGSSCGVWDNGFGGTSENCLPELAELMSSIDLDGDPDNGDQIAITYTIGFATSQALLSETALRGGGEYYEANDYETLLESFTGALTQIYEDESTFTSPAVTVDTFSRTRSRNEVLYAMFKPIQRTDWRGNVKKLKVAKISGEEVIVDKNTVPAIDADGFIDDNASTFWSSNDGGAVEEGGVGEIMVTRGAGARTIYSNLRPASSGSTEALRLFNTSNVTPNAMFTPDTGTMYGLFGVSTAASFATVMDYAQGFDGTGTDTTRAWIMGDPLHSQPTIVNYGARPSFTRENPDLRIMVGTNAGFLHMFGSDDGEEDWAFFPKELAPVLNERRLNQITNQNVYGVDLTSEVFTQDTNTDGTIDASDGDAVWLYQGLRRGGRHLYALDITDPDTPLFMFRQEGSFDVTNIMSELAQTWSKPVVTKIPGYKDGDGKAKPVIIFGAGYDPNKDNPGVASADSMGRGIFILDAETGDIVRTITPRPRTDLNLQETDLLHSVASDIAILDSNGDNLTDRLYFADTGGNVWRVDLALGLPDFDDGETWRIIKLADLADSTVAGDRRFFSKPDIVRIALDDGPVDAVLLGSGDRANPLGTDVNNYFYLLRDRKTSPYVTDAPTPSECLDPNAPLDFRCTLPISSGDLSVLATRDPNDPIDPNDPNEALDTSTAGWKLPLPGTGEKSLSASVTIDGTVFFSTFTPASVVQNAVACEWRAGDGKLYVVDIYDGRAQIIPLGPIIPDAPTVFIGEDGELKMILPPGAPQDADNIDGGLLDTGSSFRTPYGSYWYRQEY